MSGVPLALGLCLSVELFELIPVPCSAQKWFTHLWISWQASVRRLETPSNGVLVSFPRLLARNHRDQIAQPDAGDELPPRLSA